jgi:hypothetical protein
MAKTNFIAFQNFGKKKFKPSCTSSLSVLQVATTVVIYSYWSACLEGTVHFNIPLHWRCRNPQFPGSFSESLLRWTRQRRRNFGAVFMTFRLAFRPSPVLDITLWKSLLFRLKTVVFRRSEFVHMFLNIRMPRYNKNQTVWNFLSPEPEVTWRTVAIIIRVVLLSPYLCIRGVLLSSIHYIQSRRVYINRRRQYNCLIWS